MKYLVIFILIFLSFILLFIYSLMLGPVKISFDKVFISLFFPTDSLDSKIIFDIRLPRTLTACLTGAALGLSGLILRSITNNQMACPSLLGINQGAGFGIVFILSLFPFCHVSIYLIFSFLGSLIASCMILLITLIVGMSPLKLILIGQTINALFYALIQAILIFLPTRSGVILINLNGSLAGSSWELLKYTSGILVISIIFVFIITDKLKILSFGKQTSNSIGLNYGLTVFYCYILAVILSSISVSLIGPILFFPLIINHISKIVSLKNKYFLTLFIAMFGAIFLLLCDCFIRLIFVDKEISVGLIVAIIGAPILIIISKMRST